MSTFSPDSFLVPFVANTYVLVVVTVLSTFLLNAPIPLFALKFKNHDFTSNKLRYGFLILSLVLIICLQFSAIPLVIGSYVLLSLFKK